MIELMPLDNLRRLFKELAMTRIGEFDDAKLGIDYGKDLSETFGRYVELLCNCINSLDSVKSDDLAAQSALMMIRTHAITLSGFFDAIADDAEFFIKFGDWAEKHHELKED